MFWLEYKFTAKERYYNSSLPDTWRPQGVRFGITMGEAKTEAMNLIGCFGRAWRITKYEDKDGVSVPVEVVEWGPGCEGWPGSDVFVPPPPEVPEPPKVPVIIENFKKATAGYSKEQRAYLVLMAKDAFLKAIHEICTKEERGAWFRQNFHCLMNEVYPFMEELKIEEGDAVDPKWFMDHMKESIQEVNVLRYFGFLTAAQARQMLRDSWFFFDSGEALFALKLDNEASSDDILEIVKAVVANSPKVVADFKGGKVAAANSLIGQVVKRGKEGGKPVDPNKAKELIIKTLSES